MMMLFLSPLWGLPVQAFGQLVGAAPLATQPDSASSVTSLNTPPASSLQALLHTGTIHMERIKCSLGICCFSLRGLPQESTESLAHRRLTEGTFKWRREKETHIPVTSPQHPAPWEAFTSWASFTGWSPYHLDWDVCWVPHWEDVIATWKPFCVRAEGRVEEEKGRQGNRVPEPVPGYKHLTNFLMGCCCCC